jgi:hypothetical protein
MDYFSPISGVELETKTFSKTVEFDARGKDIKVVSPIDGYISDVSRTTDGGKIKIQSGDSVLEFDKINPNVTYGQKVIKGVEIGRTIDKPLELTVFNKGSKVDVKSFLSGGVTPKLTDDGNNKYTSTYKSRTADDGKKITDFALVKGLGDVLYAPFKAIQSLAGRRSQKESEEERNNLINEEIERIKKLMK